MIRLTSVFAPLDAKEQDWPALAAALLGISVESVRTCRLVRRSIDARRRTAPRLVLSLDVSVRGDEAALLARCPQAAQVPVAVPTPPLPAVHSLPRRPVVIGSGPAGLFAALALARAGAMPLILERGRDVETRRADVETFWREGLLNPDSNVQFGEGGAGTFSDGKLTSGVRRDPRHQEILQTFVRLGAPEEILWRAKPHMGTDSLVRVVRNLRKEILSLGGEVRFGVQVTGLLAEKGVLRGLLAGGEAIEADWAVLAVGHSARDTFRMLQRAGVAMTPKPFSIGARVEHSQAAVDRAQFGSYAGHPALGPAEYRLAVHLGGRGIYTFCMCPGGAVVAAASEAGGVVTNGMSLFARDGENANSALLVDVVPGDFPGDDPLAGMAFQRQWERAAFLAAGGGYRAPAQRVSDFLAGRASTALGDLRPTYRPGVTPADLRACLPPFVTDAMARALPLFNRHLAGFAHPDALLTGVETRSSCPVRILRNERGHASIRGLFPAGEGAGYAGGILSAAADGIRAAQRLSEAALEQAKDA